MSMLPYLYDIERPFRLMEREFLQPNSFFSPFTHSMVPHEFVNPELLFKQLAGATLNSILRPMEQLSAAMNQLAVSDISSNITTDDKQFQVNVDVQHFSPEEVNVKVIDGYIVVEGKHEEKRDEHGYVSRQFVRRYALPQGCLPDTVKSSLSSDGVLTITAPKVLALPSSGERIVPITHTGPVQKRIGSPDNEPTMIEEVK